MKENPKNYNIIRALHWYHWLVLVASLILTLSAWYISRSQALEKQEAQFNYQADLIVPLVQDRIEIYEAALWSGVSVFHSHNLQMNHNQWSDFANSLSIDKRLPGINGIGFIHYLRQAGDIEDIENYYKQARPYFSIHPAHNNSESWPIVYIEPEKVNLKAVGLDIAHETNRLTAARKSRDTGTAQITGPIILVQDAKRTPGFLFYAPLYTSQTPPETISQRQNSLVGLVYAPFIVSKLMQGTLDNRNRLINFKITDKDEVLYDELSISSEDYDPHPLFSKEIEVELYGRNWVFSLQSTKLFRDAYTTYQPIVILVAGIFIDILLLYLFYLFATANRLVTSRVNQITSELRQSKQHLNHVINNLVDGLITFDTDGKILTANKVATELLQIGPLSKDDSYISSIGIDINRSGGETDFKSIGGDEIVLGKPIDTDLLSSVTLKQIPVEIILIDLNDDYGDYYLCSFKDLSQQIEFKEALKATEHLLDTAINSSNTGFALIDKNIKLNKTNIKLNQWLGHPESYLNDKPLVSIVDSETQINTLSKIKELFNNESNVVNEEMKFIDKNNKPRWAMISAAPVINNARTVDRVVIQVTDFEKEHKLIQELSDKNIALEKSNHDLEQFAYVASHDLKSPLNAINQLAHWILEDCENILPSESAEHLQLLIRRSHRMAQLLEDLLKYSRVSRFSFEIEEFGLKELVIEQCELLDTPEEFSIEVSDMILNVPKVPFELVIRNLISNAIKHTDKSNVAISIMAGHNHGYYQISVKDNGPGIPENLQEKVFEMFQTLKPRDSVEGSGMGLALVKRIVEHYKGTIKVISGRNDGAEFQINWPAN